MSYDPYSRICIPIHYAPVELKIGTQRGATDRALHGTSKEGGSRNDKSKASCPACSSLPSPLLSLFAKRMQIALTLMANDATVQGKKEASSEELSATFRTFYSYALNARTRTNRSAKAVRTDVLNCVQTNHFGTIDVRKHSCVMLRRWVIRFM